MYMLKITIRIRVDFLPLERLHEALATGIVVGVRRPAHAREHLMLPEQLHVGPGGILDAPIRMMDHARRRLTSRDRVVQRLQRQTSRQRLAQRPAHHLAREPIEDHRQVDELGAQAKWSERPGVVELAPSLSSPNRTCTSQRIRLSIQALLNAKATSA